jgi:hypothetical protein
MTCWIALFMIRYRHIKVAKMGIESEISQAVEAFDRAPDWVRSLPIENSDRVIAQRVREATASAFVDAVVVVDVAAGSHESSADRGRNIRPRESPV